RLVAAPGLASALGSGGPAARASRGRDPPPASLAGPLPLSQASRHRREVLRVRPARTRARAPLASSRGGPPAARRRRRVERRRQRLGAASVLRARQRARGQAPAPARAVVSRNPRLRRA